jgi:TldD protein
MTKASVYMPLMNSLADPRRFLYRNDGLTPEAAQRLTAEALRGCDDGELYLQYTASESFSFDDGRMKAADFNTQAGFGLRGVSGETTAFAHANELSEAAIRRAAETMSVLDPSRAARPRRRGGRTPRSTPAPIR